MTMHEFLTIFLVGFVAGGGLLGYAGYWLATHIGTVRADVAKVSGQLGAIAAKVDSAAAAPAVPGAPAVAPNAAS